MRNLKKFLALVMAMVMAFSLMVTVNAAHIGTQYTDEDDVTPAFEEAMEVLTGMGVYQGDPGATFRPASTITRAETAALIYRLATGDTTDARKDLYKDYGNFADVSSTDWFAGYVGYCANAGYIKGHGGYFNPYGQVTGYEVLAMVLRAVGYDKNHEFEGATWQTNVSALSTQLGILKQVKSTDYGDRLYEASRRDVVASLLFETAANVNMVSYSAMAGYNKYVNLINNELNPTLGQKNFGLTNTTRIILGNQATGEKYTQMGVEKAGTAASSDGTLVPYSVYAYPGKTVTVGGKSITAPAGLKVDFKSDLTMFGHKTKVWYDARPGSTNSDGAQPTFAWFDKAELTATVKITEDGALNAVDNNNTDISFSEAAKAAGFTTLANADKVYFSDSFSRIGGGDDATAQPTDIIAGNGGSNTAINGGAAVATVTSTVWVLISNDNDKKVDVAIPVVLDAGQISQVNNQAATKQLIVNSATHVGLNTAVDQSKVMNPEAIKLGNTVIATKITKRTNDPDAADPVVYWLNTPYKTVTGTVVAYDWEGTANSGTQKVILDDGTELKRTIIADAHLVSGKTNVEDNITATPPAATASLAYGKYEFLLDMQGNWINAKIAYDNQFIYGTYLDWGTELGTSKFTYRMIGVDLNGEMVSHDITKWRGDPSDGNLTTPKTLGEAGEDVSDVGMPYRDDMTADASATGVSKRPTTAYTGFVISEKTASLQDKDLWNVFGIQSFGEEHSTAAVPDDWKMTATSASDGTYTIKKSDAALGVFKLPKAAGTAELYLTEETKFIVVEGYGTDSVKPVVYNGISELLGTSASVSFGKADDADTVRIDEILYTHSPYIYANTGATANQVDTILIPKDQLTRVGDNSFYYFPSKTNVVDANGSGAKLFTAYRGSEKVTVWLEDTTTTHGGGSSADFVETKITAATFGSFQYLEDTGDKAADGKPIYEITTTPPKNGAPDAASKDSEVWEGAANVGVTFKGTTNNGLTALVNGGADKVLGTKDVKVVNLVKDWTIENIDQLNDVASLSGKTVTVYVEYAEAGSVQAATIYVVKIA